jgi:hypothetical protein
LYEFQKGEDGKWSLERTKPLVHQGEVVGIAQLSDEKMLIGGLDGGLVEWRHDISVKSLLRNLDKLIAKGAV